MRYIHGISPPEILGMESGSRVKVDGCIYIVYNNNNKVKNEVLVCLLAFSSSFSFILIEFY